MPQASGKKLVRLAFVVAMIAAACSEPPAPTVDVGSGVRFLPETADSLNDAGRHSSVVTNEAGLPVVAYFGFEEVPEEGEVVAPRPVGAPSLPGVFLATVSQEGYWTRGAIAIAEQIPNVNVAFNPAFEQSVSRLEPNSVTGLQLVADGDTYHAVWGSVAGIYYATGSLDPASSAQATVERVGSIPGGLGPSIALVDGEPWIAFQTSTSPSGTLQLATPDGDNWDVATIASEAPGCDTCRTAIVAAPDGPVVAYSDGAGVQVATHDTENAWTSTNLGQGAGGQGLGGAATADGFAFSYYANDSIVVTSGSLDTTTGVALDVSSGSAEADGAATSVSVREDGTVSVVWVDADEGVRFATAGSVEELEQDDAVVDTGASTDGGAFPSVATSEDPAVTYVSWYDTEQQDVLVGGYGDFEDVPFAAPSPVPTGQPSQPEQPTEECTPVEGGTVTVVAEGIAFTDGSCIETPAGDPFTISFDNRDAGIQHNIQIFTGAEASGETLFEGDIITGPDQIDYDVPALDPGEFAFNCVVHPTMTGSIRAGEGGATGATGAAGGDGGGGAGGTTTVTAANIEFDTATIELSADQPSTIHFINEDAGVQHNIAIYEDDSITAELFQGELITGPDEIDYAIDPLAAGNYYFQCDVHPNMNGTVAVS